MARAAWSLCQAGLFDFSIDRKKPITLSLEQSRGSSGRCWLKAANRVRIWGNHSRSPLDKFFDKSWFFTIFSNSANTIFAPDLINAALGWPQLPLAPASQYRNIRAGRKKLKKLIC